MTLLEELFRPLWGIAPILREESLEITVNGVKYPVSEYITKVICEDIDEASDKCFDKDVTDDSLISFENQFVTEIAAYLVTVIFARETLWDILSQDKAELA
ncbi:MAG: hypothetical protein IJ460_00335 [Clostridia bacterium]|nr:hypothetical protein [Clostridia bacterium]